MQVTIQNVSVENVVKGRSRYSKAVVDYLYQGEPRKQTMMSFSNPTVFKQVQELIGQTVNVELAKNDAGYTEWRSVSTTESAPTTGTANSPAPATRVSGSNYETKEERAARQVLIVKQSSLSAAVATLTPGAKAPLDQKDVLDLAQKYTDWVFDNEIDMETQA